MLDPRYAIYARDGLTCLTFLAGLAAGIYFIVQKKRVIGVLTLAGIALLSLDPISQRDYYALQAVFAGVDKANRYYDPDRALHRRRQELLALQKRAEQNDRALLLAESAAREVVDQAGFILEAETAHDRLQTRQGKRALAGTQRQAGAAAQQADQKMKIFRPHGRCLRA